MNYIQYIDDTYALKVKPLQESVVNNVKHYFIKGIDTEFFILSVFLDNKRVDGIEFIDYDNLFQTSFINDLSMSDLNVIPKNHFCYANQEIKFLINRLGDSFVTRTKNTSLYGTVRPTLKTVTYQEGLFNTFKTLFIKNLGTSAVNSTLIVLLYPEGLKYNPSSAFDDGSLLQFPALQSYNNYRLLPFNSRVVQVDDIFCTVDLLGNENNVIEFRIECDIDNNHVNLSFSDKYLVRSLESNFNSTTVWKFKLAALDDDYNSLFEFDLYVDWKKPYLLA